MSPPLFAQTIIGAASAAESPVFANLVYPLRGLLLVAVAVVAVSLTMLLVRFLMHRFRMPVELPGPVLVPVVAGGAPPEIVAVIVAAVNDALEDGGHIVSITPMRSTAGGAESVWSREGRRDHFASHKVR